MTQIKKEEFAVEMSVVAFATIHDVELLEEFNECIVAFVDGNITKVQLNKMYKNTMKQMKYEMTLKQMQVESDYHSEVFKRLNINISQTVVDVVEPVVEVIVDVVEPVVDVIENVVEPVVDVIENVVEPVVDVIEDINIVEVPDVTPLDTIANEAINPNKYLNLNKSRANLTHSEFDKILQEIMPDKLDERHTTIEDALQRANRINLLMNQKFVYKRNDYYYVSPQYEYWSHYSYFSQDTNLRTPYFDLLTNVFKNIKGYFMYQNVNGLRYPNHPAYPRPGPIQIYNIVVSEPVPQVLEILNLPSDITNILFRFCGEHPTATIIKDNIGKGNVYFFS